MQGGWWGGNSCCHRIWLNGFLTWLLCCCYWSSAPLTTTWSLWLLAGQIYEIVFVWPLFGSHLCSKTQPEKLQVVNNWSEPCTVECVISGGVHECICVEEGGDVFFTGNRKPEVITGCPRFFILYLMRGRVHGDNPFTKLRHLSS